MTDQTNMRLPDRTRQQIADLRDQCGMNITDTTITAIDALWRARFEFSFNRACTELAIDTYREQFFDYWQRMRTSYDECHPLDVWETIYRCFETQRDHVDERATQKDALV